MIWFKAIFCIDISQESSIEYTSAWIFLVATITLITADEAELNPSYTSSLQNST